MAEMDWKEKARDLYFGSGMGIGEIAVYLDISRQSVSGYLKHLPGYGAEQERRKAANSSRRKEYKKEKNRQYRACMAVTGETLRREHDLAALILSREKYH